MCDFKSSAGARAACGLGLLLGEGVVSSGSPFLLRTPRANADGAADSGRLGSCHQGGHDCFRQVSELAGEAPLSSLSSRSCVAYTRFVHTRACALKQLVWSLSGLALAFDFRP